MKNSQDEINGIVKDYRIELAREFAGHVGAEADVVAGMVKSRLDGMRGCGWSSTRLGVAPARRVPDADCRCRASVGASR